MALDSRRYRIGELTIAGSAVGTIGYSPDMALRDVVGTTAKMSAGFWTEVAKLATPERPPVVAPRGATDSSRQRDDQHRAPTGADGTAASPEGVLVPVDTWTRVMDQLGNLHEAGQQLAEAKERAARAETQVEFLREQLATARAEQKRTRRPAAPREHREVTDAAADGNAAPRQPQASPPEVDLRTASKARVTNARTRVSNWLRPS